MLSKSLKRFKGFTLAELLICLAILGEIATFTIPKVLTSQQNQQYNAVAKEAISMTAAAYQKARYDGIITTFSTMTNLTQYMNYVAADTSSSIDSFPTGAGATLTCNVSGPCIKLHSGALLKVMPAPFITTSGYTYAYLDPDGVVTGTKHTLIVVIYYNGRVTTYVSVDSTVSDPAWFSW